MRRPGDDADIDYNPLGYAAGTDYDEDLAEDDHVPIPKVLGNMWEEIRFFF